MWHKHLQNISARLIQGKKKYNSNLPSLLLVHGSGGCASSFLPQLYGLDKQINVAAIDLPGHGLTPGSSYSQVEDYANWLAVFLQAGPIRPILLGHSLGGAIVMTLALTYPHLLQGLILASTGSRFKIAATIRNNLLTNYYSAVLIIVKLAYHKKASPRLITQAIENLLEIAPEILVDDFTACNQFNITSYFSRIFHPTLVLVGEGDRLTPLHYSQSLANSISNSRLKIIIGAGHMAHLERYREFNQAILDFIKLNIK